MEMGADAAVKPSTGAAVDTTALSPEKAAENGISTVIEPVTVSSPTASSPAVLDGEEASGEDGGEGVVSPDGRGEENGVKESEAPTELSDETKAAIVKQVEFYFSDENLPTDPFMKKKIKLGGAQGWVPLKVVSHFPKVRKLSKDLRAIALALEASTALVVAKATRVRRKVPFKFPDKDGMSDVLSRTVLAVNLPPDSTVESLTPFFSACGVTEAIRVIRKGENKDVQPPVGPQRDYFATCQYSTLEAAIKASNELTDRKSWRGGLRVTLANGLTAEKAMQKLKAAGSKKAKQEQKERMNVRSPTEPKNIRDGQMRSRSLTALELEQAAGGNGSGSGRRSVPSPRTPEEEGSSGDSSEAAPWARKPRSVSNVDAFSGRGGAGVGDGEDGSPPRHATGNGESLPRKGVVQTVSAEGWSWIKKDGNGSRKSGNRIPFSMADVVRKDGDDQQQQQQQQPLQKGDRVEYHTWRDSEGTLMAVRVERAKERPRSLGMAGVGVAGAAGGRGRTDRATQAHFRMAVGPEEGNKGFAAGRGRPVDPSTIAANGKSTNGDTNLRRPRGSSMGGPESKVFVPASAGVSSEGSTPSTASSEAGSSGMKGVSSETAVATATVPPVVGGDAVDGAVASSGPSSAQFEDADS